MEIAKTINDVHAAAFMQILATTYQDHALRPWLCRLACVMFEGTTYLAATDGVFLIALPTDPELPLGDYEGVPHLVEVGNDRLCRAVNGLIKQFATQTQGDFYEDDNVSGVRAYIDESFFDKEVLGTDVLLAHVADGKFVIDMEKPYTHIISRNLYERAIDAIGFVDHVRYSEPNKMIGLFNKSGFGFALIMPMRPDCKIRKFVGG